MADTGRLQADPLFQGLARPVLVMGVSYMYFVLNVVITMIVFINTKDFFVMLGAGPFIHLVGYLVCRKEPRAVELLILKTSTGYKSYNNLFRYHHNTNSYDVF